MKRTLSLLTLLIFTASMHGNDAITAEPVTHQLALRMYSFVDAQVVQASEDAINKLSEQFIQCFADCAQSAEERVAIHKENTRFALEQAVYFRKKAANILIDIAYTSFETSLPADVKDTLADVEQLERVALTWNYVAIALICHAEKEPSINSAQENLLMIKNLLAR
jgi:hypothetical protein